MLRSHIGSEGLGKQHWDERSVSKEQDDRGAAELEWLDSRLW